MGSMNLMFDTNIIQYAYNNKKWLIKGNKFVYILFFEMIMTISSLILYFQVVYNNIEELLIKKIWLHNYSLK